MYRPARVSHATLRRAVSQLRYLDVLNKTRSRCCRFAVVLVGRRRMVGVKTSQKSSGLSETFPRPTRGLGKRVYWPITT
jgi:hypothetical protein